MSEPFDDDPQLRERLRATDPAASLAPADPDRVARLLEATMTTEHPTSEHPTSEQPTTDPGGRRTSLTWLAAAAAVVVVGGVVFAATTGDDEDRTPTAGDGSSETADPSQPSEPSEPAEPSLLTLAAPAATTGRCMVPTAEALATQEVAFLGTVEQVDEETVTLAVEEQYAGAAADEVRVEAPPEQMQLLVGAVEFREGGEYLVSATDGAVSVCGFSGPAAPDLQALYEQAFGG
ncbi:hypothetical protein [Nocardioides sp. Arc9.136]|uniref:hypothetical protein n=1 Tax=Nocardioides sp. Arc9.136 TaxID=2996826 RepID=UPI0026658239|nr:hypothetical protein [Nocardioides sp. Arc9.136]WKN47946.1 hypothetical protein OSR43_18140 [Nocardioides sp. Arc9.136]